MGSVVSLKTRRMISAVDVLGEALRSATRRIGPVTKHELADLVLLFARELERHAAELREGQDGPLGED